MHALVVIESMFGNTREVGRAVAGGLSGVADVEVVDVADAPDRLPAGTDLLVVGAPTHAFSLSRPSTRADARRQAGDPEPEDGTAERGAREWLDALTGTTGVAAAVFDTRVAHPRLPGSAARAAQRRLRSCGCDLVAPPETFWVAGTPGPLCTGELERAGAWGAELARLAAGVQHRGRRGA